jgi:hypothetical protein
VITVRALKTVTFLYVVREDRIVAAINAGRPDAWSCWLTRRLTLAVLERATEYLVNTSALAQRTPQEFRDESIAFEREAAIANTAKAMSNTPPDILQSSASAAELAERLTISRQDAGFGLELHGQGENGAAGTVKRAELTRILQMLQGVAAKAGWTSLPTAPQAAPSTPAPDAKPARH